MILEIPMHSKETLRYFLKVTKLGESAHLRSNYLVLEKIVYLFECFSFVCKICKMKGLCHNTECKLVVCGLDHIRRSTVCLCVCVFKAYIGY